MAIVQDFADGYAHMPSDPRTTLDTLCGICHDPDNRPTSKVYSGKITCTVCRGVAKTVFDSCKKSEVK